MFSTQMSVRSSLRWLYAPRRMFSASPAARNDMSDLAGALRGEPSTPAHVVVPTETTRLGRGYQPGALPPAIDPVLDLFTNMLMKHGKKAEAQKRVSNILTLLQRATNQSPAPLLFDAIEQSSPAIRMLSMRKAAKTVQSPRALNERQRMRQGIVWLLKAAERGRGSGAPRDDRIAREVLAVLEGSSDVFRRIEEVHRLGMMNRSSLNTR